MYILRFLNFIRANHGWAFWFACMNGELVFLRDCLVAGFYPHITTVFGESVLIPIVKPRDSPILENLDMKKKKEKSLAGAVTTILVGRRLGILSSEIWLKIANYVKEDIQCWETNRVYCAKLLLGVRAGRLSIKEIRDLTLDQLRCLLEDDHDLEKMWRETQLTPYSVLK